MSMLTRNSLFSFTVIILLDLISVHCFPTGEIHSSNNEKEGSWSDLSDILEMNHFDPSWQDEVQSGKQQVTDTQAMNASLQANEENKSKPRKRKSRSTPEAREKQRIYSQKFKDSLKTNPLKRVKFNEMRMVQERKREANKMSKMTDNEREIYLLHKKQTRSHYRISSKEKYGGFSSLKMKRLHDIRIKKGEGTATEDDLKYLQDHNLAKRKNYAAHKQRQQKD
ncbi:uncharacterized protein FA14DRAFT_169653 [Meira miltonrushii]|uniref:Uncharacterized protein n=1 Tax=Meira miltonrushii TaxID=1280837 RepID=A0A316VM97_9BASI|nr:uncharacterized protein FA14DRAFT_169653 [Meira miltonrushii]PWN36695.1 hypothetical protein FA14DRAFT_169653 [Meira miltonrushii]